MSSKSEFYIALNHLCVAARDAQKAMPESLSSREKKLWGGLLSRLPEQIEGLITTLDDPHAVTYDGQMRRQHDQIIIP